MDHESIIDDLLNFEEVNINQGKIHTSMEQEFKDNPTCDQETPKYDINKKQYETIRNNEKQFRSFFEASPDYCYIVSPDGKIVDINQNALRILGKQKDSIIGKQIIPIVYKHSQKRAKQLVKKWLKEGKLRNEEINIYTKNGDHTVLLSVEDIKDDHGRLLYSVLMQKDITHINKTEKEIEHILDAAADGIRIIGTDFKVKKMNKTMAEMAGVPIEKGIGMNCSEMFGAKGICGTNECSLVKILKNGKTFQHQHERKAINGKVITCLDHVSPYKDKNGNIIGIIESFRDITYIQEREKELRDQAELFQITSEQLKDSKREQQKLLNEMQERTKELQCNIEVSNLTEDRYRTIDEIIKKITFIIPSAWQYPDIACAKIEFNNTECKTSNYKQTPWRLTSNIVVNGKKNGYVEVNYLKEKPECDEGPFLLKERRLIDSISKQIAITSERRMAAAKQDELLQKSNKRVKEVNCLYEISKIIENPRKTREDIINEILYIIPSAMLYPEVTCSSIIFDNEHFKTSNFKKTPWVISADLLISEKKRGTIDVYYLEERIKKDIGPFLNEEKKLINAIARQISIGLERRFNEEELKRNAEELEAMNEELLASQETLKENQRELEEMNSELQQSKEKLRKSDELKTAFLNITSHELRTPMSAIKGYVQMVLKKGLGDINNDQEKSLNIVVRNINRLDNLIQDILDISRLEAGTMKFIPEPVSISSLVQDVSDTMNSHAETKDITIHTEVSEDLPDLTIDCDRIKQVIINLTNNAIKFSEKGSDIIIKTSKNKNDILFEIQDFGRGIPNDKLDKVFDTFYQVDSGMDRKFGGAGLGLAISRGIVLAHNGAIWVESKVGKGSTFKFTLPIESVENLEERFREVDVFRIQQDKNNFKDSQKIEESLLAK